MRPKNRRQMSDPTLLVKKALKGAQKAAQTATTVIGTVASEIAGERVLQPNSPASMVTSALQSANKTKQLARRIYYSYTPRYREGMVLADISRCFRNRDEADKVRSLRRLTVCSIEADEFWDLQAFAIFDRDGNGDATLEEIEMSCLDIHRERVALSRSMHDIDSAVGRLDSILVSIWWIVAVLIMLGLLNASFQTMITGSVPFALSASGQVLMWSHCSTKRWHLHPRSVVVDRYDRARGPRFDHLPLHQAPVRRWRSRLHRRGRLHGPRDAPALDRLQARRRDSQPGSALAAEPQVCLQVSRESSPFSSSLHRNLTKHVPPVQLSPLHVHHRDLCVRRRFRHDFREGKV